MQIQFTKRPGRYVRYCASDVEDLCAYVSQGDWLFIAWELDGDSFAAMYLTPDPLGLIASVNSHPGGFLFDENGVNQTAVSWSGTKYVPTGEVDVSGGFFYIRIEGISVTLTDGSICSVTFVQQFNGEGPTVESPEFSLRTNDTSFNLNITSGTGRIDWGDGSETTHGAVVDTDYPHTYSSPGTYDVLVYTDAQNTTQIEAPNQGLLSINIGNCDNLVNFEVQNNTSLATITPPTLSNATWVRFLAYSCGLTGTLNMSACLNMGGRFEVYANSGLTGILFPVSDEAFITLYAYSCNLTGTLSMVNLSNLSGQIQLNNNSLLTAVLWPASSGTITRLHLNSTGWIGECDLTSLVLTTDFEMRSCTACTHITFKNTEVPTGGWTMNIFATYASTNMAGELDVSMFNIGGSFQIYSCDWTSLVTNPSNTASLTLCRLDGNLFAGNLDISDWNTNGNLYFSSNPGLETLTHSANSGTLNGYYGNSCILTYYDTTMLNFGTAAVIELQNNAMTAAEVNHFLVDFDSNLGAGTGIIRIAGTNAAPDGSSGGYDGTTAKANLIIKGWSVTTS